MADDKETTQRKIYLFPVSLVRRISAFQKREEIANESEAVRRLLDEALRVTESPVDLMYQCRMILERTNSLYAPVKEILVGHPNVESIVFNGDDFDVTFREGVTYSLLKSGAVMVQTENDDWEAVLYPDEDSDDEIPF
ncbi:hypothetical protein [Aureimonas ureilytica]|uniref:hypothetical protein n=1 Tax=Aureimonas ureilytica TaxID=401562 RepID=UPI00036A970F|nr:hypothetical protein [Aureimonas ureilytica]